tara:strand:- start:506 stop:7666 length:7161 start_codon:yes stop_codon:yes gene_type:complete
MSSEENISEVKPLQTDVCEQVEKPVEPDRICPTCIPSEDYVVPDWWDEEAPFLNEKTCEYWTAVSINQFGDSYTQSDLQGVDPTRLNQIMKTYIRSGIRKMLRHFDKLETDGTVCGAPPDSLGGGCRDITGVNYQSWIEEGSKKVVVAGQAIGTVVQDPIPELNPAPNLITNPKGLELYGNASDYYFYAPGESILLVLVTVPAYIFDQVPKAPEFPSVDIKKEEVVVDARKFRRQLAQLKRVMKIYAKYQSFFYQQENGRLMQERADGSYKTIYLKYMNDKLDLFEDHLDTLIDNNGYSWATFTFAINRITDIKIVFNKEDEDRPFDVEEVYVKAKGCDWTKMTVGFNVFKSSPVVKGQTVMGYIASINDMEKDLLARVTPPWLDFVVKYTYPPIDVNYGISHLTTDPVGSCALKQLEELDDFILDSVLSFSQAFAYQLNKQNCKMLSDLNLADPANPNSEMDSAGLDISKAYEKFRKKVVTDYDKKVGPVQKWMKDTLGKRKKGAKKNKWHAPLKMLNPCRWKHIVLYALKCLMGGMDIKQVYLTFIKKTLASLAGEGLEIVLGGLPQDKYDKIMEIIRREFKDMPMPWETKYLPGEVPEKLQDTMATRELEKKSEQIKDYNDRERQNQEIYARLQELGIDVSKVQTAGLSDKEIQQLNAQEELEGPPSPEDPSLSYAKVVEALTVNYVDFKYDDIFKIQDSTVDKEAGKIKSQWDEINAAIERGKEMYDAVTNVILELDDDETMQGFTYVDYRGAIFEENKSSFWIPLSFKDENGSWEITQAQWSGDNEDGYKWHTITDKAHLATATTLLKAKIADDRASMEKRLEIKQKKAAQSMREIEQGKATLESKLRALDHINSNGVVNKESLKSSLEDEVEAHRIALTNNNRVLWKTDSSLFDNKDYLAWDSLDEEGKEKAIEQQKQLASRIYKLEPGETVVPGTLGKALGNVQKAVVAVLIEAILQTATIQDIMAAFDSLPGSGLIASFLASFKCPNTHFIWPPIDTFLNTLTFDPCGPGKTGIALPKIPELGSIKGWTLWGALKNAFLFALQKTTEQIVMAMLMKVAKILDKALCVAMGVPGKWIANKLGRNDKSFGDIVDELICGNKNKSDKEKNKALEQVFKNAGASPKALEVPSGNAGDAPGAQQPPATGDKKAYSNTNQQTQDIQMQEASGKYRDLSVLLSRVATKNELLRAMTSMPEDQDLGFMRNISNVVKLKLPEFSAAFEDEEATIDFFTACGNLLTPEQRQQLQNKLDEPGADMPIDKTICLTSEQKEQWDNDRISAFENAGLHPDVAKQYVDKINDRVVSDFADGLDALISAPEEEFQRALNEAFTPADATDPDCKLPSIYDPEPGNMKEDIKMISEGLFKRLQKAFVDDMIDFNPIERFFGDPPGILSSILSDKRGFTLNYHNFVNSNTLFRSIITGDWGGDLLETPETIGIVMKNYLDNNTFEYEYLGDQEGIIDKEKPALKMDFETNEDDPYKSKLFMYDVLEDKKNKDVGSLFPIKQSFDYKLKIRAPGMLYRTFVVDKQFGTTSNEEVTPELTEESLLLEIEPDMNVGADYRVTILKNFIERAYKRVGNASVTITASRKIFTGLNGLIFNDFRKKLLEGAGGGIPEGFYYGDQDVQLTKEDLTYVGPNGEDYDYEEEDMVLGKSKTDNPRVKYLDPAIHGGTYNEPFRYIESAGECGGQRGWMKLARIFIPEIYCNQKETDFLYLKQLMDRAEEIRGKIDLKPELEFDPECVVEKPFDKIASPMTLANLEASVLATIRIHITDFLISAMPVISNINFDFGRNYDEAISEYIMYKIERACINEVFLLRGKWEGHNYYLLFLEQVAQTVMRMIDNEEIVANEELTKAYGKIEKARDDFSHGDFKIKNSGNWGVASMAGVGMLGMAVIAASGPIGLAIIASGGLVKFVVDTIEKNVAKWAMKLYAINEAKSPCRTMLKYLIREQINFYSDELALKLTPRPYIYDTTKYFLGASDTFGDQKKSIKAGLTDVENPVGGGVGNIPYGEVYDVVETTATNPLPRITQGTTANSFVGKSRDSGAFYFEKYVRILAPDSSFADVSNVTNQTPLQSAVLNRDISLRGVVKISKFKNFLQSLNQIMQQDPNVNISDAFGEFAHRNITQSDSSKPPLSEEEESGLPSPSDVTPVEELSLTGVKFGVRLCFVPPEGFSPNMFSNEMTKLEKSYVFESQYQYDSTKYIFPICSYEHDLPDATIQEYIESDGDLNQEIKCYIDKLAEKPEYTFFFDKLFDMKRTPSLLAIYSSMNFLPSIGLGEDERNEEESLGSNIQDTFNDSKYAARRLFISLYKRKDFDPPDEEDDYDFVKDETRRLVANVFGAVTFENTVFPWQKRRLLDKPYDCEGKVCGNPLTKLYETKEK